MASRSHTATEARKAEKAPNEPQLDSAEIQGNIIPGFMKPHQRLVTLVIDDAPRARAWLAMVTPHLTSLAQAMHSRLQVRQHRCLRHSFTGELNAIPGNMTDAWVNIAFTYQGLTKLAQGRQTLAAQLDQFQDEAFIAGLPARSAALGDPTDPAAAGHPRNWKVGGGAGEPDILLIFASDQTNDLDNLATELLASLASHGLRKTYDETGHKLNARGTEHFGFKDGVSQPGVRGRYSERADAFITPRTIAPQATPESWLYGLPGQYLIWPGEFVFGYPGHGADPLIAGPQNLPGPTWSRNGSYLVFRRLSQDVPGFRTFLTAEAAKLAIQPGFTDFNPALLGAYLIGRWPSGAPVPRSPDKDDPDLGANRLENNYFEFGVDATPLKLTNGECTDHYPTASADPIGLVCPMAAHIRKVNSRLTANDQGGIRASYNRRILRRGLPYGKPYTENEQPGQERGLLFLCYQASIADQFEFLVSAWMGSPTSPRSPSGHDLVIGQNGQPGEQRIRTATLIEPGGHTATVTAEKDVVTPTGGGYFFSPSISTIHNILSDTG